MTGTTVRTGEHDQPEPPPAGLMMAPIEVERLLPLAIQDLLEEALKPTPRGNPAKLDEWEATHRRIAERKLARVGELYRAHLDFKIEVARP